MTEKPKILDDGVKFDSAKFLAAVHYVIWRCSSNPDILGKTKLHKTLYYADMVRFFSTGKALTGAEYVKSRHGPTARYLDWALRELAGQGAISTSKEDYFGLSKFVYRSLHEPKTNLLSGDEKNVIDEIMEFVCKQSARAISEYSHAQPWQDAAMGERIPYSTAYQLYLDTEPTDSDREWAKDQLEVARRLRRS